MLQINNINKAFGATRVLQNVSLELPKGETLAVLGRSGCGKTTLLKIIAGLLPADAGEILQNDQRQNELPPQRRNAVYLYQEALLFPHLNVWENIAFGLRLRKTPENELKNRVEALLVHLGLQAEARRMPQALSGGQKQRVAFGRAIIIEPQVLLLDEPFGALDPETRSQMQDFYQKTAEQLQLSAVFVTHDLKEALRMGTRWAYLDQGQLQTYPTREAFVRDPKTGIEQEIEFWKNV
jgi:ABC-type sugar transport system ATPase subunit